MKVSVHTDRRRCLLAALLIGVTAQFWSGVVHADTKAKSVLPHLKWADLVPPGWDPAAQVKKQNKGTNFDIISDSDPRMLKMLKEMREVWDNAPTNPAMDGVRGRIPGYLVPLEESKDGIKEMLLVPYYGACIHSPPPPANQIIHVFLSKPVKGYMTMDPVWVSGTLKAFRGDSYLGTSGYRIDNGQLQPYVKSKVDTAQ